MTGDADRFQTRILVVDKDPSMLAFYQRAVISDSEGYHHCHGSDITQCMAWEEALESVKDAVRDQQPYGIVIIDSDHHADQSRLWETCRQIRDHDPHLVFVVWTSSQDCAAPQELTRMESNGNFLCMHKPLYDHEIRMLIRTLSAKWQSDQEIRETQMLNEQLESQSHELSHAIDRLKREIGERKRVETTLLQKKQELRGLINNIHDVAWVKDCSGTYTLVNDAFAALMASAPEELLGKSIFDLLPEQYAAVLDNDEQTVLSGAQPVTKSIVPFVMKENKMRWYEVIKTPLYDDSKRIIGTVGTSRDVTEHKHLEDSMQVQSEKLEEEIKKSHRELVEVNALLSTKRSDLDEKTEELKRVRRQLRETKSALSVIGSHWEENRQQSEWRIMQRAHTMMVPIIERLTKVKELKKYQFEFDLLLQYINELTSDLANDIKIAASLSVTELRVASMIKNGLSNTQIARHLFICPTTVKTHRKNIRRKLKLNNSGVNLRSYLEQELGTLNPIQTRKRLHS